MHVDLAIYAYILRHNSGVMFSETSWMRNQEVSWSPKVAVQGINPFKHVLLAFLRPFAGNWMLCESATSPQRASEMNKSQWITVVATQVNTVKTCKILA